VGVTAAEARVTVAACASRRDAALAGSTTLADNSATVKPRQILIADMTAGPWRMDCWIATCDLSNPSAPGRFRNSAKTQHPRRNPLCRDSYIQR